MKYINPIVMFLLTFLVPIQGLLLLTLLFILLDTITAVYVVVKQRGWKHFTSEFLRKGLSPKIVGYLGTIILGFMIDKYIVGGTIMGLTYFFAKGICSLWIYTEVKSIDENSQKLGNRSFFVIIKEFIKKMSSIKDDITKLKD